MWCLHHSALAQCCFSVTSTAMLVVFTWIWQSGLLGWLQGQRERDFQLDGWWNIQCLPKNAADCWLQCSNLVVTNGIEQLFLHNHIMWENLFYCSIVGESVVTDGVVFQQRWTLESWELMETNDDNVGWLCVIRNDYIWHFLLFADASNIS